MISKTCSAECVSRERDLPYFYRVYDSQIYKREELLGSRSRQKLIKFHSLFMLGILDQIIPERAGLGTMTCIENTMDALRKDRMWYIRNEKSDLFR